MQRPRISQSPYRVGSGPSRPPISRGALLTPGVGVLGRWAALVSPGVGVLGRWTGLFTIGGEVLGRWTGLFTIGGGMPAPCTG
jgi:hypothetical protein